MRSIGYVGAGTMEFLRDPAGRLHFMEVNTRLQVEHPVTEMVTGFDLVKEQIRIAANHALSLTQDRVSLTGHAIECRIDAEDPFDGFRPCPGLLERLESPATGDQEGVRVRLDTHVRQGYRVPVFYDSMIGKLIVGAGTREAAIRGMLGALGRLRVEGVRTTIPLHQRVLGHRGFVSGSYDTGLVAQIMAPQLGDGGRAAVDMLRAP
jgi:acetyl-CoA carboxylase biotin carboxylase subunit